MLLSTQAHAIIRHKMESCLRVLTSRSLLRVTSPSARRHSNNGCKLLAASHLSDSAVRRCPSSWNTTDSNDATASLKTQMFKLYADPEDTSRVHVGKLLGALEKCGIRRTDRRLTTFMTYLRETAEAEGEFTLGSNAIDNLHLNYDTFDKLVETNLVLFDSVFNKRLVIPDFQDFCKELTEIYFTCKKNNYGNVATYIPQLAKVSKDNWAMSICTVDGQRFSIGPVNTKFTLQSCSKPFTYAICLNELGEKRVHEFVSHEPSGANFNSVILDSRNKPHNPMLNSGAIICSSLLLDVIQSDMSKAEKFDWVTSYIRRIAGKERIQFNNAVFLSERETADRNYSMAYFMKENKCFPPDSDLYEVMDMYFQTCSMEVSTEALSVMGATLANGGVCPTTSERVLEPFVVRNVLSLMFSCGMYNYSGSFAFKVGLPAKSGVSGGLVLVIPNVMAIGLWSPSLDSLGNSSRCIQFCEALVNKFNFHHFDNLKYSEQKLDPRRGNYEQKGLEAVTLLFAANAGDRFAMERMLMQGVDFNGKDYDLRTALHIAAAGGHIEAVKFLVEVAKVDIAKDRWGFTPCDEAERFGHVETLSYLQSHFKSKKKEEEAA